jgi:serine protease Do
MSAVDGGIDPYLQLLGPDGSDLATDDDSGEGRNARLVAVLTQNGDYTILATALGGGSGAYTLSLREPRRESIGLGETVSGRIEDGVIWRFTGAAGQVVALEMDSDDGAIDPYLELFGPDGSLLASDDDSGGNLNARLVVRLTEDGDYTVLTTAVGGREGAYNLSLREEPGEE